MQTKEHIHKNSANKFLSAVPGTNGTNKSSVFLHEIKHIIYDMPAIDYVIGLDMQEKSFERDIIY